MSETIYVVTGSFQYDEESGHWNVASFRDETQAYDYARSCKVLLEEYYPKYAAYVVSVQVPGCNICFTPEYDTYRALSEKATKQLRARVGDPNLDGFFMVGADIDYTVETTQLY
jgi:hypothetical protein